MRWLLPAVLLFVSFGVNAQDLTGIWRGYFYANLGPYKEYYKYEVQIDQLKNNSLKGVTYSYRTTVFYGKANFEGIWFPKAKSLLVKETNLVEVKMMGNSQACAMTCNLQYVKDGDSETLKGTFTSVNTTTKTDCGSGTVYLERVQQSDFTKEDFLLKKKKPSPPPSTQNNKTNVAPNNTAKPKTAAPDIAKINAKKLQAALGVPQDGIIGPKSNAAIKREAPEFNEKLDLQNTSQVNRLIDIIKKNKTATVKKAPPANNNQNKKLPPPVVKHDTVAKSERVTTPAQPEIKNAPPKKVIPVPDVIKSRSNPLVKTITTNAPDIKVELYDNGEIDGDTITVYDNNQVIAWRQRLTDKPITLNIKADENTPVHEFVMVADNLGSIPPNTALMIITTGGKRYQLYISSDKQKNARVEVTYEQK